MKKIARRGLAVLFVGALTATMSVALAAGPAQVTDEAASMTLRLGSVSGGVLGPLDLSHTCVGGDGDTYVTVKSRSTPGDAIASVDTELAGPVVVTSTLTSDTGPTPPAVTPSGPQGEGVSSGAVVISPTAFPGTRWIGPFTSVIQVIDVNNDAVGRGLMTLSHQKFNKLKKRWIPDGKHLVANVEEQIAPITSGPDTGKFGVSAGFGPRSGTATSAIPVLGAKTQGSCP